MKDVLIVTDPEKIKLLADRTRLEIINCLGSPPWPLPGSASY